MKQIIYLTLIALLFGCSGKEKGSKILPNYEKEYNYNSFTENISPENKILIKEQKYEIKKNISALINENEKNFNLKIRLFINEKGKLDYVKFVSGEKKFLNDKELKEKILNFLEKDKFVVARNKGESEKYAFDIVISPEGTFDDSEFVVAAEKMPSIVGGIKSLAKKIVYPDEAKKSGVEGRVFIKAYIDEKGNVVKSEVLKGIGHGCDKSALNAVSKLHFVPAENHGKKVKAQVVIPVMFRLQ